VGSLAPVDRATLAYALVATVALALHWPVRSPGAALLPVAHAALIATALLAGTARRSGRVGQFLGDLYPLAIVTFLYAEVGILNATAGRMHDPSIQAVEQALFGTQPSSEWIRHWPWPWLSTLLHAGYLSFYPIVALPPVALWIAKKRGEAARVAFLVASTFYTCYALFLILPVAGPRYLYPRAENPATSVPLALLAQALLNSGAAWGTAFPSSHVAVAFVASIRAGWASRALGWIFVPLAVLLTCGTVYGQFHYAVDALCGVLLALVVLVLERRRMRRHARADSARASAVAA
jgi:membrane-associated phospholipid phosphatase